MMILGMSGRSLCLGVLTGHPNQTGSAVTSSTTMELIESQADNLQITIEGS
jgi:hypothetical protein